MTSLVTLWCRLEFDFPDLQTAGFDRCRPSRIADGTGFGSHNSGQLGNAANSAGYERADAWKWDLTRRLYKAGFERKDILELYRLVDWLMRLPEPLEQEYKVQLRNYETQRTMQYITIERMGREERREQGRVGTLRENVMEVLETRFGIIPAALRERVNAVEDAARLKGGLRQAVIWPNFTEFERATLG